MENANSTSDTATNPPPGGPNTVEKAAAVYAQARLLNGGSDAFPNTIPDAGLRAIAETYHLPINGEFLEG